MTVISPKGKSTHLHQIMVEVEAWRRRSLGLAQKVKKVKKVKKVSARADRSEV